MKDEQPLKSMLEKMKGEVQFKSVLESIKEERLIEALHGVLEEKRYLVVFDDIWTIAAWDCLKPAFAREKKGSKVLFTTRNRTVASHADPWSSPVEPPFLTDNEEDWEFKKRELIRMWIAEGFILESSIGGEETMEDVGEEYLEELVRRCMVQHTEDAVTNSSSSTLQLTSSNKWRRIAIHPRISGNDASKSKFYVPLLKSGDSHLRSLFYFIEDGMRMGRQRDFYRSTHGYIMTRQQGRFIFENFRLLRVLKIDYMAVPTTLGNWAFDSFEMWKQSFANLEPLCSLHRLTKVELRGAIPEDPHSLHHNLEHLPSSLAKLTLVNSQLKRDPMGILEKLSNLRFLCFDFNSYVGSKMVCSAHGFPQLETLKSCIFRGTRRMGNRRRCNAMSQDSTISTSKEIDDDSRRIEISHHHSGIDDY
ncbi:hypothetical protein GH714_011602 [Hevea brasiliensis]|uniref:NB-ARC domain-containing protein n=1 Tax=Hevea brasiliensis TaxID=3981 RepID=A0A6A6MZL3_HEVBR|nr:hypothetical protein GH714_011602 [Hevea brasiliensis]